MIRGLKKTSKGIGSLAKYVGTATLTHLYMETAQIGAFFGEIQCPKSYDF
jgi:hypothetical protein